MRFSGWQRIGIVASDLVSRGRIYLGNKTALDEAGEKT